MCHVAANKNHIAWKNIVFLLGSWNRTSSVCVNPHSNFHWERCQGWQRIESSCSLALLPALKPFPSQTCRIPAVLGDIQTATQKRLNTLIWFFSEDLKSSVLSLLPSDRNKSLSPSHFLLSLCWLVNSEALCTEMHSEEELIYTIPTYQCVPASCTDVSDARYGAKTEQ